MPYAYCSAPGCNNIELYGADPINKFRPEFTPMPKFCKKCGAPMIGKCPTCGAYRDEFSAKYCPSCGKAYK